MENKNYLMLKTLNGREIKYHLGDDFEGSPNLLIEERIFKIDKENIEKNLFSFGMSLHEKDVEELIATLERGGYGWYSVNIHSNPHFGSQEIYNSHYDLGRNTSNKKQEIKAKKIFSGLINILENKKFTLHIIPGPSTNPKKLNSSRIFLTERK